MTNSLPNVAASTVFCHFENQIIGVFCTNRKIPVCERLVTMFPAWLASTKIEIVTGCPRGSGMLGGNSSSTSP
jgi:hypothetical protein